MARSTFAWLIFLLACGPACSGQNLRISVLSRYRPTELELRPSGAQALVVSISNQQFVLAPDSPDAKVEFRSVDHQLLIAIHGESLRARSVHAAGRTGDVDFVLSVPGKVARHYFGRVTIAQEKGELDAIVTMDLETAVASVVEAETDAQTPLEALKAQAVVTRSYYLAGRGRHEEFDFCDLAHCQVLRSPPAAGSLAARATQETRGLVLAYRNQPFAAMFTRSCGGRTRTPAQDGLPANGYPYFAVACDYCRKDPFRWTRTIAMQDAAVLSQGENGRLTLCRRLGWNAIPSDDFTERKSGSRVFLEGEGQGHGIGLCQRGSRAMAETGADFRTILAHYFPNARVMRIGSTAER